MTVRSQPLDIGEQLRGRRLFITGATGFIGKVLVEKLLWSLPEVETLRLLIRPTPDDSVTARLRRELLDSPVMARLRALHADGWERWAASKIEVVSGDLAVDRFGLDAEAYTALARDTDQVIACGATVTFDERLDRALAINTRGALRTLELARDAGARLVHVSTCFVNGTDQGSFEERVVAGCPIHGSEDPEVLLATLEEACRHHAGEDAALVEAGAELAAQHGFHDVYTLSKALAERLIDRRRGEVAVAIVRPAIVESAHAEPIPGWIEAVRVADPLLVAYGRGVSSRLPGRAGAHLHLVPVDHVVNALIAVLAELTEDSDSRSREIPVYQLAAGNDPPSLEELMRQARAAFLRTPLTGTRGRAVRPRRARFMDPARYQRRLRAGHRAARWLANLLGETSLGLRVSALERRLAHFERLFEIYRPYLDHGARYEDRSTQALCSRLSATDRGTFSFDRRQVDWPAYIRDTHVPGLIRFALRAAGGTPPPSAPGSPTEAGRDGDFPAAQASTLYELFRIAAQAAPNNVALQTYRDGRWLRYTYGQALTAIANIASNLRQRHDIGLGDRVVLWGRASPEWVLTSFAVHRLGAATVPLDPQWPGEEIEQAARFTDARLVCADPGLRSAVAAIGLPVVDLAAPFVPEPDVGLLPTIDGEPASVAAGDLACLLFTSGTTVAPRAVPLTHANLMANVRDLAPVMRLSRERLLSVLPIHHVFEFMVGLLVPLVGGSTISYVAKTTPEEISWTMQQTRPTMLVAVPRLLELLHDGIRRNVAGGGPLLGALFRCLFAISRLTGGRHGRRLFGKVHGRFGGSLRRIATGGSALDPELGRAFQLMGFNVAEGYGMTETSPVLTVNPWGAPRFGSVGRPLAGVDIDIRPSGSGGGEPAGGSGSIWVRGSNVMAGYYRDVSASAAALSDGWLDTGDTGYLDEDGYLHIEGRTKDVIVTAAGKNVYPEEVERRYRDLTDVQELVVLGLPAKNGAEIVAAVVVPRPDTTDSEVEGIKEAIAARSMAVPSYQQLSRVEVWRGELPKTTTLKIKRGLLREAILSGRKDGPAAAPGPAQSVDHDLPAADEIWALGTLARLTRSRPDALRRRDRLVELGVDSLTKVELVSEIEARCGRRIDDDDAAALASIQDVVDILADSRPGPPRRGAATRSAQR